MPTALICGDKTIFGCMFAYVRVACTKPSAICCLLSTSLRHRPTHNLNGAATHWRSQWGTDPLTTSKRHPVTENLSEVPTHPLAASLRHSPTDNVCLGQAQFVFLLWNYVKQQALHAMINAARDDGFVVGHKQFHNVFVCSNIEQLLRGLVAKC